MRYFVYCLVAYAVVQFVLPMLLAIAVFSALMVFMIPIGIMAFISSFKPDYRTTQEEEDEQAAQDQADIDEYYAQYDDDKQNRHY